MTLKETVYVGCFPSILIPSPPEVGNPKLGKVCDESFSLIDERPVKISANQNRGKFERDRSTQTLPAVDKGSGKTLERERESLEKLLSGSRKVWKNS